MAASAQGIWNQLRSNSSEPKVAMPKANASDQTGSSSVGSTSIAANDFLTLLVTEMKNQDPTATTDPNEYVNQLVQVNSLQQLISINETLQKATALTPNAISAPESRAGSAPSLQYTMPQASGPTSSEASAAARGAFSPNPSPGALRIATALTSKQ